MIDGVSKIVIEVENPTRALSFWTETLGFELCRDITCGEERWLEVRTPDRRLILVLSPRREALPNTWEVPPTSNVFFSCDDLAKTYDELRSRGVKFTQPPVELSFGWWSIFCDHEGNSFALHARESAAKEEP